MITTIKMLSTKELQNSLKLSNPSYINIKLRGDAKLLRTYLIQNFYWNILVFFTDLLINLHVVLFKNIWIWEKIIP